MKNSENQTTGKNAGKNRAQIERERILAQLDAADSEVPQNPGKYDKNGKGGEESFSQLFESSLKENDFKVGDVVKGKVVEVQTDYVLVDISYKSEGLIPINE